jgi:cell wall-associated NlpC family hydrolase
LATSSLPAGCVGAGVAGVVPPSHSVVTLGTPASDLGASGYPASASVIAFGSSSVSGAGCSGTRLTVASVSLFEGAVTASTVEETHGRGTVAGLEIDGTAVSAMAGQAVPVDGWGQLTLGDKFGRLSAALVLRLLKAHDGLLAGTRIAVAFSATSAAARPSPQDRSAPSARSKDESSAESRRRATKSKATRRQAANPLPDFPASGDPFVTGGALAKEAHDNPVVSLAMQYLGVPYQWGGASPQTGFDCSGLVTYVFGRLGVSLPHFAAAQWESPDGVWVSPHRLKPGDLVFFTGSDGTRKAPGHVGIYVGDGYLIDAPHTGAFVQVDSLDEGWFAHKYVGARRIVSRLLDARHALHVTRSDAPSAALLPGFPSPLSLATVGEPLGVAAAGATAAQTAWRGEWIWVSAVVGALLVVLSTGGFLVRRRLGLR